MITIPAIYEKGVFRPLEKVDLPENSLIELALPDAIAHPTVRLSLAGIYETLSFRFDSGQGDLAARHDEHQP